MIVITSCYIIVNIVYTVQPPSSVLASTIMRMDSLFAILFLLNFYFYLTSAQFTPHILCQNTTGIVKPRTAGAIQYIKNNNFTTPCSLTLTGFERDKHVSIPGVDLMTAPCQPNVSTLTINQTPYCVTLKNSSNKVIIPTADGRLEMTLDTSPANNFTLVYYTNGKF